MKKQECKADPTLIKNPFICNTSREVRLSLDKDPRRFKGNTQFVTPIKMENGNTLLNNQIDPKLSYMFGTKEPEYNEFISGIEKYDYEVPAEQINKTSKVKHERGVPLSFLQVKNEEEEIEWYAKRFPKIPDELLPIIARHHWGEPITKKGLKNEKKKIEKKLQKQGLKREEGPVIVKFD